MIFLDANAFYSYIGRKNIGLIESNHVDELKLAEFLDSVKEKSLPTSVFIEIMVHFRNQPDILKYILNFREEKKLTIFNNIPDYCISEDEITCVHYMGCDDLKNYAYNLLEIKIDIECKFTYLFYEITKNLYLEYKLRRINNLSEQQCNGIWGFLGKQEFKEKNEELTSEFNSSLHTGYEKGKEQNLLKSKYIDILDDACKMIDCTLAACVACIDNETDVIMAIQRAYEECVENGLDGKDGTMPSIVSVLQTDVAFLEFAKGKISQMFVKHGYNKFQAEYLKEIMFTAWFNRAQKLKKNDIFDMLCSGCLAYVRPIKKDESFAINTESYIMSFDSTMEKYIGKVRPSNFQIINKFKY